MDKNTRSAATPPSRSGDRRAALRQQAHDRRTAQRYLAFEAPVQLGWWEGGEFRIVGAMLKDVSLGGLSAVTQASIPDETPVLVRLQAPRITEWIQATTIDVRPIVWFQHPARVVRLRFNAACPYAFFTGAIDAKSRSDRGAQNGYLRGPKNVSGAPSRSPSPGQAGPQPLIDSEA